MNTSINIPAQPTERRIFGFWSRLRLSLKLMLAFTVMFIFAAIIAAFTLWGFNRTTTTYEHALEQGAQLRAISDQLSIDLLQARRAEKNFLLRWRQEGFDLAYANYITVETEDAASTRGPAYIQNITAIREDVAQLAPFGTVAGTVSTGDMTKTQYDADVATLKQNVETYDQNFTALVELLRQKGYDENTGWEGEFRTAAKNIESKISGQAGLEQMNITYLLLRRSEKDYLERGAQEYVDAVHRLASQLKVEIDAAGQIGSTDKADMNVQLNSYLKSFDALVELDKQIAIHNEELIAAARAVEPLATEIEKLGEQLAIDDIATARTISTQTLTISIVIVLLALALSIVLSIFLSRQITRPVVQLTGTAEEIAGGNFEVQAEVSSADEIGTLARTFNSMTSRLQIAFEEVRRRALAVQTSAEVSRRLSAAITPRQLAIEVVEQVQAAFHYYHAHIYFIDETTGDLVMTGGTGEAGATMLARGHKIPKGRGLVGRAAETNAPVLVPDVSQAKGWLPNPLLPETRSETAIPISSGKQVLGVLDVQQNVVNGLGQSDVELLQSLAGQVAISYQNARTFEESRAKAELESMVNVIGQRIQRTTSLEEALQTAIRELGTVLGATRVKANLSLHKDGNN